ncbi:hypothetical protein vseg_012207 [Gypsophila vaccaria]
MGCGESKHAVATTESLSKSKRFSSQNSKKVHNNVEQTNTLKGSRSSKLTNVSNDTKKTTSTIEKTNNNEVSTSKSCTSPDLIKKETPVKVFNVEGVRKNVEEPTTFDDDKTNSSIVLNNKQEEKVNELNLVETCAIQEKENEGDKKELHLESQDDNLLVKETSPSREDKVESFEKTDEKVLEPFVNQVKAEIESENKESTFESQNDIPSSANNTNIERQSLLLEPVEEPLVKEDMKSINMSNNDERDEQMKIINIETPSPNQEKEKEVEASEPSHEFPVDQLSINNESNENRSPSHENIVEIEKKDDVEPIILENEINQSINKEAEMPQENSSVEVSSEATNEVKKEDSQKDIQTPISIIEKD